MRARLAASGLVVFLFAAAAPADVAPITPPPAGQMSGQTTVTPAAARQIGLQAMAENRPDVALEFATALAARNTSDPFAYYLMASALRQMNRLPEAQSAAKLAFHRAQSPEQRYQASRLTALLAYDQKHYGAAQWWLRRAAQFAPEDERRVRSIREFGAVRAKNPLSVDLRFSVVPSDNVNNGSSGAFNIIDGVPYVGTLSPEAQALSGLIIEGGATLQYRIRQTDQSATFIGAKADVRVVTLSRKAKDLLAGTSAPDQGSQRLELSVTHVIAPKSQPYRLRFGATVGRLWQTGVEAQDLLRLASNYTRILSHTTALDLGVSLEARERTASTPRGDAVYSARAVLTHQAKRAGTLSGSVFYSVYDTSLTGRSSVTVGALLAFAPSRDLGPARLSINLGVQKAAFDGYSLAGIVVPGGRQDTTGYAELQVWFPKMQYMGFAPELSLRHQSTHSNVSRFQTSETSVTLGIRSTF